MTKPLDIPVVRAKITADMIGRECLIVPDDEAMSQIADGEIYNATVSQITSRRKRSYEQLGLYWAACKLVAENTDDVNWNSPLKTSEQCKIAAHLFDDYLYYENKKTGVSTLHIVTGSISFKNLPHLEACGYFNQAFPFMAEKIGLTVDELIEETKKRMKGRRMCENCNVRIANQTHHKFSQSKANIEKYGTALINAPFNKMPSCDYCNTSHAHMKRENIWSEAEFRSAAIENGYEIQ